MGIITLWKVCLSVLFCVCLGYQPVQWWETLWLLPPSLLIMAFSSYKIFARVHESGRNFSRNKTYTERDIQLLKASLKSLNFCFFKYAAIKKRLKTTFLHHNESVTRKPLVIPLHARTILYKFFQTSNIDTGNGLGTLLLQSLSTQNFVSIYCKFCSTNFPIFPT